MELLALLTSCPHIVPIRIERTRYNWPSNCFILRSLGKNSDV